MKDSPDGDFWEIPHDTAHKNVFENYIHLKLRSQLPWVRVRLNKKMSDYNDVIMRAMASQINSLTIVYSIVYSRADQRKYQSSAPLAFVRGIPRWQQLHNLSDSLQTTLYCHIDTWFVTCSLWICHCELLYIYGINDVWILNLVTGEFPAQRASNAEIFPFDDVIIFLQNRHFHYTDETKPEKKNQPWY